MVELATLSTFFECDKYMTLIAVFNKIYNDERCLITDAIVFRVGVIFLL